MRQSDLKRALLYSESSGLDSLGKPIEKLVHSAYIKKIDGNIDEILDKFEGIVTVVFVDFAFFLKHQRDILKRDGKRNLTRFVVIAEKSENDAQPFELLNIVWAVIEKPVYDEKIQKIFLNALNYLNLYKKQLGSEEMLGKAQEQLDDLYQIGIALSNETDLDKLLDLILAKSKELTMADAGSLYLVEDGEDSKYLRFKLSHNDSSKADYTEFVMPINKKSISGYVALTGETLVIDDTYKIPEDSEYQLNRSFDESTNYNTISMMVCPMKNHKGEIIGVIQLMNKKRTFGVKLEKAEDFTREVIPFDRVSKDLIMSLASQASVAIENAMLYENLDNVFEAFVRASVGAIEDRSPITSGHSNRVKEYTIAVARAINDAQEGVFKDVHFTDEEMRELQYAAFLHDFGKVAVRETVMSKEKKLYPEEKEIVKQRFETAKLSFKQHEYEKLSVKLSKGVAKGEGEKELYDTMKRIEHECDLIDGYWTIIEAANEPKPLPEGADSRLDEIAKHKYLNSSGEKESLLTNKELTSLKIPRGNFTSDEREEMNNHVIYTSKFLSKLPWTRDLKNVSKIASMHHERLDGSGYPEGLSTQEIPLGARIMMITDIFDALTATDRPYKKPLSPEFSLKIIEDEVKAGRLDADIFNIFKENEIWRHAERYMKK